MKVERAKEGELADGKDSNFQKALKDVGEKICIKLILSNILADLNQWVFDIMLQFNQFYQLYSFVQCNQTPFWRVSNLSFVLLKFWHKF